MGTGMSFPKDEQIVAKANKLSSDLHKAFEEKLTLSNSQDNISSLLGNADEMKGIIDDPENFSYKDIQLMFALDKFNKFVTYKLNLEPLKNSLSADIIGKYKSKINPYKKFHLELLAHERTEHVRWNPKSKESQLYLCGLDLIEINSVIFKMTDIKILQLCCNYLKYLPYGIEQMKNLRVLTLGKNKLRAIPAEIGYLKDLRELDLSHNKLSDLPKSLIALKRLNTLRLDGNYFKKIPSFVGKLHSLKMLSLAGNEIRSIPFEIFKLPFLMSLSTTGCRLQPNKIKKFGEEGRCTLQELASREIVRKNHKINRNATMSIIKPLLEVQECCFCGGPFFNYYIYVEDNHVYENEMYPIHYKMCTMHYKKHEDRITTLFEKTIRTYPGKLYEENSTSVEEVFERCSYDRASLQVLYEQWSEDGRVPLACLTLLKEPRNEMHTIEELFRLETEDTLDMLDKAYTV